MNALDKKKRNAPQAGLTGMKQILEKKELFHHEFSARHRHGEVNEVKTAAALVRWSPSKRCIDRLHRQTGRSTENGDTFFFSPDL